jgi:hypothetical protein
VKDKKEKPGFTILFISICGLALGDDLV